ncbi:MAG: hypothetical protein RMJ97_06245 [Raineya sp.]|nr:cold shock domain-containing protein [Raineya sp.]MDW8296473.1 hypothetical protein [Raineya sp.]
MQSIIDIDTDKIYTGKVVFWNAYFGFIQCEELQTNIFFHKKNISKISIKEINFLDKVSFKIAFSKTKKYFQKPYAYSIRFQEQGNLGDYHRKIGILYDWNGKFGYIHYPTEGKKILLFHTRVLFSKELNNQDLIIFHPVISTKDTSQLFAFFAYHIKYEKNIEFLKEQYLNNPSLELYQHLKEVICNSSENSNNIGSELFKLEMTYLERVDTLEDFLHLTNTLKKLKSEYRFQPDVEILKSFVSDHYILQLWENNLIESYDFNLIQKYFERANIETKKEIIARISDEHKKELIYNYYLDQTKDLTQSRYLREFLSIIQVDETIANVFSEVKDSILLKLSSHEIIDLWLNNYIDTLENISLERKINVLNEIAVVHLGKKINNLSESKRFELSKILEEYLDRYITPTYFDLNYPKLVIFLKIYKRISDLNKDEKYLNVFEKVLKKLTNKQKFILWIFKVDIDFSDFEYIKNHLENINHYFRLRFLLRLQREKKCNIFNEIQLSQEGLIHFALNYQWNELIQPISDEPNNDEYTVSFLIDIKDFFELAFVRKLADIIYNNIPLYNVIHLRLWLYEYVDYYDYVGYRENFKNLTRSEKNYFRNKMNDIIMLSNITEQEIIQVVPCTNFVKVDDETTIYNAFLTNLYFGDGIIMLKREDGRYTDEYREEYSSTGLNRIPSNHPLSQENIVIKVIENKIEEISGLDTIFSKIHTANIQKALNKKVLTENSLGERQENTAYAEDWNLRKQIVEYLNQNQYPNKEIIYVNEPKNFYRHLDENSGVDTFEKTALFTIKVPEGYGIIWENIDLSEDKATYVFKSTEFDYENQINKIKEAISSYAQLRSVLISRSEKDELLIFKRNLGYLASIRKRRGKPQSFSNWLQKLEKILLKEIPPIPSAEEMEKLKDWHFENNFSIITKRERKQKAKDTIKESELSKVDIFEITTSSSNLQNLKQKEFQLKKIYLEKIKAFNEYFEELFNIKF